MNKTGGRHGVHTFDIKLAMVLFHRWLIPIFLGRKDGVSYDTQTVFNRYKTSNNQYVKSKHLFYAAVLSITPSHFSLPWFIPLCL